MVDYRYPGNSGLEVSIDTAGDGVVFADPEDTCMVSPKRRLV